MILNWQNNTWKRLVTNIKSKSVIINPDNSFPSLFSRRKGVMGLVNIYRF